MNALATFRTAIAVASFRAWASRRRYRVRYDSNNYLWTITETTKRI